VEKHLDAEAKAYMEQYVGFPDCAVDRIIPPVDTPLAAEVFVERYHEWDVERGGFKGDVPNIPGMEVVDDLTAYLERKLFTLNGPNAVTACYGWLKGYETINESLADREIYDEVRGMMEECSAMLVKRHGFTPRAMEQYSKSLMQRFVNPYIIDRCVRVAREPIRKLSPSDRITAPMNYANAYGIDTPHYYKGVAAVLLYDNPDDSQSVELQRLIAEHGVKAAYEKISGVKADSPAAAEIEKEYIYLKKKYVK
jgi:mannitol-1-phosphate 5-dehydrogenase